MADRDTYKYHLKQGHKVLRSGITKDLERREDEHQREYGEDVHIYKVGRATTEEAAKKWEQEQDKGTP